MDPINYYTVSPYSIPDSSPCFSVSEKEQVISARKQEQNKTDEDTKKEIEIKIPKIKTCPEIDYKELFKQLDIETEKLLMSAQYKFCDENCRFSDILCPADSNVPGSENDPEIYLHANYVLLEKMNFILTQYPLVHQIPLFWITCFEQNVGLIVDLTNKQDVIKHELEPYTLSEESPTEIYEDIFIQLTYHRNEEENISFQEYEIKKSEAEKSKKTKQDFFKLNYMHFSNWPDGGIISEDQLNKILDQIEIQHQKNTNRPLLIHCIAGVGRSGTITTAYAVRKLIKQHKITELNLLDEIKRLIVEGRKQRGPVFVQTRAQLKLLHQWAWKELFNSL